MHYRLATHTDTESVAQLHAESWRNSYRGMLSDDYLQTQVVADRRATWQQRLQCATFGQYVLLAEDGGRLCGFICLFANADPRLGTLLDNLHVAAAHQGQGIGRMLMYRAAYWVQTTLASPSMHLWVFASNAPAIRFYERLGGRVDGEKMEDSFGTTPVRALRYVWDDVAPLVKLLGKSNRRDAESTEVLRRGDL